MKNKMIAQLALLSLLSLAGIGTAQARDVSLRVEGIRYGMFVDQTRNYNEVGGHRNNGVYNDRDHNRNSNRPDSNRNSPQNKWRTPLEWAEALVKNVQPDNTLYRHKDSIVTWTGVNGATEYVSFTDCSGLINALLKQVYDPANADKNFFKNWMGKTRPVAETYHQAILDENHFRRVRQVQDIRPNDLIAIKYPDGSENTGHIMLVAAPPQRRAATKPFVDNTEQWEVTIIDSSKSGHGKTDTRHNDDNTFRQGVGKGSLRLYATKQGEIVGYSWSTVGASEFYGQEERNLVVGSVTLR